MSASHRVVWIACFTLLIAVFAAGCGDKEYPAELTAAKAAVADAKAEGAADSCPDEYSSAEAALKKAEALYEEGEDEEMKATALESSKLAQIAEDCASGKKAAAPSTLLEGELPEELAKYQESILFDFNSNTIRPSEAAKLKGIASFIKQQQEGTKFWVILTCHADRPGSPQDNFFLTKRRGIVVREFLIGQGVDKDRILVQPMGEYLAATKQGKDNMNQDFRKVVFTLYPYKPLPGQVEGSPFIPGPYNYYSGSFKSSK